MSDVVTQMKGLTWHPTLCECPAGLNTHYCYSCYYFSDASCFQEARLAQYGPKKIALGMVGDLAEIAHLTFCFSGPRVSSGFQGLFLGHKRKQWAQNSLRCMKCIRTLVIIFNPFQVPGPKLY